MTPNAPLYQPNAALVVFTASGFTAPYIEFYDMDESGSPVNPHPLTVREAQSLAKALDTREQAGKAFLRPEGILPANVLHLDPSDNGSVVWYTKPQRQKLHFAESLGLQNGTVALPALVWKANKKELQLFALNGKSKPKAETPLFHAPFLTYTKRATCVWVTSMLPLNPLRPWRNLLLHGRGIFSGVIFPIISTNTTPLALTCLTSIKN